MFVALIFSIAILSSASDASNQGLFRLLRCNEIVNLFAPGEQKRYLQALEAFNVLKNDKRRVEDPHTTIARVFRRQNRETVEWQREYDQSWQELNCLLRDAMVEWAKPQSPLLRSPGVLTRAGRNSRTIAPATLRLDQSLQSAEWPIIIGRLHTETSEVESSLGAIVRRVRNPNAAINLRRRPNIEARSAIVNYQQSLEEFRERLLKQCNEVKIAALIYYLSYQNLELLALLPITHNRHLIRAAAITGNVSAVLEAFLEL